jgi:hypothetical protein
MNFGPRRRRTTATRSWTARSTPASTSSTPPTSTAGRRARETEQIIGAGSRRAAAGARRSCSPPRSTADGRLAQRLTPVRAPHPPRVRRSLRGCRPTTSTCTRCTTSTATRRGTRSGRRWRLLVAQGKVIYVGSSNFAGWHIARPTRPRSGATPRPGQRAEPLQPRRRARSSSRSAGVRGLRPRRHPVEPARRGLLGGILRKAKEGRSASERTQELLARSTGRSSSSTRRSATSSAPTRRTSGSPGCCTSPA